MEEEREKVLVATCSAVSFKPDFMTNDKLEAATRGHGSLVIPVYCAANALAEDVFCGVDKITCTYLRQSCMCKWEM